MIRWWVRLKNQRLGLENLARITAIKIRTPIPMPTYRKNRGYFSKNLRNSSSAFDSIDEPSSDESFE
jgi:hypothetical protein